MPSNLQKSENTDEKKFEEWRNSEPKGMHSHSKAYCYPSFLAGIQAEREEWEGKTERLQIIHVDFASVISEFTNEIQFHKIRILNSEGAKEKLLKQIEERMNALFHRQINCIFKEPAKKPEKKGGGK